MKKRYVLVALMGMSVLPIAGVFAAPGDLTSKTVQDAGVEALILEIGTLSEPTFKTLSDSQPGITPQKVFDGLVIPSILCVSSKNEGKGFSFGNPNYAVGPHYECSKNKELKLVWDYLTGTGLNQSAERFDKETREYFLNNRHEFQCYVMPRMQVTPQMNAQDLLKDAVASFTFDKEGKPKWVKE